MWSVVQPLTSPWQKITDLTDGDQEESIYIRDHPFFIKRITHRARAHISKHVGTWHTSRRAQFSGRCPTWTIRCQLNKLFCVSPCFEWCWELALPIQLSIISTLLLTWELEDVSWLVEFLQRLNSSFIIQDGELCYMLIKNTLRTDWKKKAASKVKRMTEAA